MSQEITPDPNQKVQTFSKQITRAVTLNYLLFLPKDCQVGGARKWPLMLFLHGAGERGNDIWLVTKHGPPKIVRNRADFPFILVSPQCPNGQTWSDEALLALLDEVIRNNPVDTNRVCLTGLSMGGYGTWSLGVSHPEKFAAIVPICGGGDPLKILLGDPRKAAHLRSLPVWAFHGAKDPVVKTIESERMVDAMKQLGAKEVELTVYPEAGHDSWTEAYDNPKLYDWLLAHSRQAR